MAEGVKNEGRRLAAEARSVLSQAAGERKNAAADFIQALATAVDRGAEELADRGRTGTASLVRQASGEIDSLARQISSREPGELLAELSDFARRRPALVTAVAVAAGFAAMRFFMSTADRPTGHSGAATESVETRAGREV